MRNNPYSRIQAFMSALSLIEQKYNSGQIDYGEMMSEQRKLGTYRSRGKGKGHSVLGNSKNKHAHMNIVRAARRRNSIRKRA